MRESMTADREANAIKLQRSHFLGAFLLVEGSTDRRFYQKLINEETCRIIVTIAGNSRKKRAIELLTILEESNFTGILAIVDADFDRLNSIEYPSPNLFLTDTHDAETMMLKSAALERVLDEYGSDEKRMALSQDIRTIILETGTPIGYLRWISQQDNLNLTFEDLKFSKFIDERNLTVDETQLIKTIQAKSKNWTITLDRLTQQKSTEHDRWQVCCGHDLVKILAIGLQRVFGSCKEDTADLEKILRLAYRPEDFLATQLYQDIRTWETHAKLSNPILNLIPGS
jgi:Protein of unknown function (DUF4435)